MSFISMSFALFVVITVLVYYAVPSRFRWWVLLAASYIFYMFTGINRLAYILITTISTFVFAYYIDGYNVKQKAYLAANKGTLSKEEKKAYKATVKKKQRWLLFACLIINFGILLYLKYINWSLAYINLFRLTYFNRTDFIPFKSIVLPLGISFYTFQSMGYLLDVYNNKYESEKNPFKFALFVSFFPQIIQGPISRFDELAKELFEEKKYSFLNIKSGFYRIMWGLFKKLIIADRLAGYVNVSMDMHADHKGLYLILAIFFYSMQIYGDFSGGIDVALGVAEMLGIRVTENFDRPFFSKSISEYWRRWHITLGTWFKDYIFYPLSINKKIINIGKWFRNHKMEALGKRMPIYLPMVMVWFTTGMWHGSENKYVVWGLLNCLIIIIGTEFEPVSLKLIEKYNIDINAFWFKSYKIFKTFWLMAFLRVFDIARNVSDGFTIIGDAFRGWGLFSINEVFENMKLAKEDFIVAIIAILIVFIVDMIQRSGSVRARIFKLPTAVQWVILSTLIAVVTVFGYYGRGYDAQAFIYLQF